MATGISVKEMLVEVERELHIRHRVYPVWVEQKKLAAHTADRRLAIFEALALRLKKIVEQEEEPTLFSHD